MYSPAPRISPRTHAKSGFTLIELLTVIAIIGILAAILIPTISKVRSVAKAATCSSNLREIGRMCALFANDNKGRMPSYQLPNRSLANYYYTSATVPKSYGNDQIAYSLWPYYYKGTATTGATTATSAPSQIPLLMCPSFKPEIPEVNALHYTLNLCTAPATSPASGYNVFPYGSVTSLSRMITLNNVSNLGLSPAKVWLMQDYDTPTGDVTKGIASKPHHESRRNRVYMDGSVRSLPLADSALDQF